MKPILFTLMLSILSFSVFSQKNRLDSIKNVLENGIYERQINFGYVSSPNNFDKNFEYPSHNELTFMFYRFDFFEDSSVNNFFEDGYMGKVFISERYLESDYLLDTYKNCNDFKNDKDGFFMFFKLYYNEQNRDFRINVYPEYVYNICRKDMHWNTKVCKDIKEHEQTVIELIKLNDKYYKNFFEKNDNTTIKSFVDTLNKYNNDSLKKYNIAIPSKYTKIKKNLDFIRIVNFKKQIKCFVVNTLDESSENLGKTLQLAFTKYSYSEDLLENSTYKLNNLECEKIFAKINTIKDKQKENGVTVTRNVLYRSLAVSPEPDDFFIENITSQPNLIRVFLTGNESEIMNQRAIRIKKKELENARKDSIDVNKEIENLQKILDKDSILFNNSVSNIPISQYSLVEIEIKINQIQSEIARINSEKSKSKQTKNNEAFNDLLKICITERKELERIKGDMSKNQKLSTDFNKKKETYSNSLKEQTSKLKILADSIAKLSSSIKVLSEEIITIKPSDSTTNKFWVYYKKVDVSDSVDKKIFSNFIDRLIDYKVSAYLRDALPDKEDTEWIKGNIKGYIKEAKICINSKEKPINGEKDCIEISKYKSYENFSPVIDKSTGHIWIKIKVN